MTIRREVLNAGEAAVMAGLEARDTPRDIARAVWNSMSAVKSRVGAPVRRPADQGRALDALRRGEPVGVVRRRFGFGGSVMAKLNRQVKQERAWMMGEIAA
jgi:hypothetical protein